MNKLGLGDDVPVEPEGLIETAKGSLVLLSPTQCVMDRLAWFYHNNDRQCLDQSVLVSLAQSVSQARIKKLSEREGALAKYEIYKTTLKQKKIRVDDSSPEGRRSYELTFGLEMT
jgi:hypothetical protein